MAAKTSPKIQVPLIEQETIQVMLIGRTGLICERMSFKAKNVLFLGGKKKTAAEKATIKHHPREEFVDSMYVHEGFHPFSHVKFPAMAFKSAMATAALVTPGINKTDVQRLVYIPDEFVPVFGVPRLRMDVVRSADMRRTPDIRTRAFFPEWATQITVTFARPQLSQTAIITLFLNAGIASGVGGFRQEKGKGSFGTFEPIDTLPTGLMDADAQLDAIRDPVPINSDSEELLAFYDSEVLSRK